MFVIKYQERLRPKIEFLLLFDFYIYSYLIFPLIIIKLYYIFNLKIARKKEFLTFAEKHIFFNSYSEEIFVNL